jgi:hypothetical protein
MMRWWVVLFVGGCAGGDSPGGAAEDPYIHDEDLSLITPELSVEEVEVAMQQGLELARNYHANGVIEAYTEAMANRSGGCPNYYSDGLSSSWYDECVTGNGTSYSGYVYTGTPEPGYNEQGAMSSQSWWLSGGAVIETAAGERLELTGSASHWWSESEWGFSQSSNVSGNFYASGGAASDSWLAAGLSPDLTVSSWYGYGDWSTKHITANGVVFVSEEKASLVAFDGVRAYGAVAVSVACEIEPAGTISVRGDEGYWYDVLFDGVGADAPEGAEIAPEDCDGCGRLFFRGIYLGQACVDVSPLLDWSGMP